MSKERLSNLQRATTMDTRDRHNLLARGAHRRTLAGLRSFVYSDPGRDFLLGQSKK
ncbi:hypothetical protein ES705_16388 [subsurface metagenome]